MNRIVHKPQLNFSGCLLVAAPHWEDPLYRRSVCMVVHQDSRAAVGVMLNRTLAVEVQSLLQQFGATAESAKRAELFLGGLQSGPVVALHQRSDLAEFTPADGVYFAAQVDSLKRLVKDAQSNFRIYVGQVVWEKDLLNQQFENGCWLPMPVSSRVVFEAADTMWLAAMRQAGNRLVEAMLNCQSPSSIDLN